MITFPTDEILSPSQGLNSDKEAPWKADGKELTAEKKLAKELRGYKAQVSTQTEINKMRTRGYSYKALKKKVFDRY